MARLRPLQWRLNIAVFFSTRSIPARRRQAAQGEFIRSSHWWTSHLSGTVKAWRHRSWCTIRLDLSDTIAMITENLLAKYDNAFSSADPREWSRLRTCVSSARTAFREAERDDRAAPRAKHMRERELLSAPSTRCTDRGDNCDFLSLQRRALYQ